MVFAGVGVPLLAAVLAQRRHAPDLTIVLEGGIIGPRMLPGKLPISTNEMRAAHGAPDAHRPSPTSSCRRSAASSTTASSAPRRSTRTATSTPASSARVGRPTVRLPGSGGANDIVSLCHEVLIVTAHEPRRFVERVDFVTSPGYLAGGDSRRQGRAGLPGRPSTVVTDLALLDFEPEPGGCACAACSRA